MSNPEIPIQTPNLTVGERINHPFLLAGDWMKFSQAVVKEEGMQSEQEVREAALNFESSIPDELKDDEFYKERKKSVTKVKVDARPIWCGVRVGEPKYTTEEKIEPYRLKRACVNLLQRIGYLSKMKVTQILTGETFTKEDEDALRKQSL